MTVHYALNLTCSDCGADITYEDEQPAWRSGLEALDMGRVVAAEEFTRRYPILLCGPEPRAPYRTPEGDEIELPPFVEVDFFTAETRVALPGTEQSFAPCPSCGGRAYPSKPGGSGGAH